MENIAILMGGDSEERSISFKSGETIYRHIDKEKYQPYKVIYISKNKFEVALETKNIKINASDFSFVLKKQQISFKKVFMMIHGSPGEDGQLCSYFEARNIKYTSSKQLISQLTFNKFKCNNYLKKLGYQVPNSCLYKKNMKIEKFPIIIKPSNSGSSLGISKAYNVFDFQNGVKNAKKCDTNVIIEEFIEGREFTCAVFAFQRKIRTLPITEIISENDIFDYDAKYNGKSIEETPAKIDLKIKNKIKYTSEQVYKKLKLKGVIRIDFIVKNKEPYIIEINTIPGFSEDSIVPKMLKCANISLTHFINSEIERI